MNLRVGTIRGRHPLPVDCYLLDGAEPGQAAYDAAATAALELNAEMPDVDHVDLYFTGLTEATFGAADAFAFARVPVTLWRWDVASETYQPMERRMPVGFAIVGSSTA